MKNCKKAMTILLTAAVLLTAVFMTGCTRLTPAQDDAPPTADTPAIWKNGVYIRVERDDVASVYMRGGSFSKVGENADGSALKAGEWTECTFSFRAADGGRVTLEMGGQWAQNKDAREWVLVGPVKVNGEVLPNSDYAKTYKAGNGRTMPSGYWLAGVSEIVPGAGPDGKAAIRTNHDNRFYRVLEVEPGKTYTVSAMVKPAE